MPSAVVPQEVESEIRAACDANDHDRATTVALRHYGPPILGWLIDRLRSRTVAEEAFAIFAEDLWRSWEGFAWRCSARGWAYALARNAANRHAVAARRGGPRVPLSQAVSRVVAKVRSETRPYMRTPVKDRMRELREQLSEEERTILVLRVDRKLPWSEIAHVIAYEDGTEGQDRDVTQLAARLRKRFQYIKAKLRDLATDAGLL